MQLRAEHVRKVLVTANILAATTLAALGVWFGSTYALFLPHAVGFIGPTATTAVAALWGALCILLAKSLLRAGGKAVRLLAATPLVIALAAALCIYLRYQQQQDAYIQLQLQHPGKFDKTWHCCTGNDM